MGKNEDEYVKSFDNIAEQYTDAQLRVICKFLPLNVKAVLEANSPKYQELVTFGGGTVNSNQNREKQTKYVPNQDYHLRKKRNENSSQKLDILEKNIGKSELTKPVVIPGVSKPTEQNNAMPIQPIQRPVTEPEKKEIPRADNENNMSNTNSEQNDIENILSDIPEPIQEEAPKKRRGRPRKVQENAQPVESQEPKRRRGRPRKIQPQEQENIQDAQEIQEPVDLFNLGTSSSEDNGGLILPGLEDESTIEPNNTQNIQEPVDLFNLSNNEYEENENSNTSNTFVQSNVNNVNYNGMNNNINDN